MKLRIVPLVMGIIQIGIALLISIIFHAWWAYLISAPILGLGIQSMKVVFSASEDELEELTGDGPLSNKTGKKYFG